MKIVKTLSMKRFQTGVTLVELMVSIVLGLILLSAATAMTVSSMVMNADTLSSGRLNQDMDTVMHVMVNDIRRTGYSANFTAGLADVNFSDNEDINLIKQTNDGVLPSCILYAYNADGDDLLDPEEKYGFRRSGAGSGDAIEMRTTCGDSGSTCSTSCSAGTWVQLTDPDIVSVTELTFSTTNSKCISLTHPDSIVSGNENNYWITTSLTAMQFPCMALNGTGLTNFTLSSGSYVAGAFVLPVAKDRLIGVRHVNIQISSELTNDDEMVKNQTVGVNVRNHHIRSL